MSENSKLHRDEEFLHQKIREENLSCKEIARNEMDYEISPDTISKYKNEYNIKRKSRDEEWLRENYRFTSKTKSDLAEEAKVEWVRTIGKWLEEYDIKKLHKDVEWIEKKYCKERLDGTEIADEIPYEISAASIQRTIRKNNIERCYQNEDWLREQYIEENKSMQKIAENANVNIGTIQNQLHQNDIDVVSVNERWDIYDNPMKGVTGKDHHSFKEDKEMSDQKWRRYSKWNQTRKMQLEIDQYECQLCGSKDELEVHHITPVSEGGKKYSLKNLITLCRSCHMDVHVEYQNNYIKEDINWINEERKFYC